MNGKIAHRIVALFVVSAFIPLLVSALLTYKQVTSLINQQVYSRLFDTSKTFALSVNQRLVDARDALLNFSLQFRKNGFVPSVEVVDLLKNTFARLEIIRPGKKPVTIIGNAIKRPLMNPFQRNAFRKGEPVLIVQRGPHAPPHLLLVHLVDPTKPGSLVMIGELNQSYVWEGEKSSPYMTGLCMFAESGVMLFCSTPDLEAASAFLKHNIASHTASNRVLIGKIPTLMGSWQLFLKPELNATSWTALALQPMTIAMAPANAFSRIFFAVIVLTLMLVALLSVSQIRRIMVPLEKLIMGTRRLAVEDFSYRVDVPLGDEFGELATSFNNMSARLGSQIDTLKVLSSIDRVILTKQNIDPVFEIALTRIRTMIPTGFLGVIVFDDIAAQEARLYFLKSGNASGIEMNRITVATEVLQELLAPANTSWSDGTKQLQHYISQPTFQLQGNIFVLPIMVDGNENAVIVIETDDINNLPQHVQTQLLDLADRIGVALSAAARNEQLIYQARHDDLSGLPNRLSFKEQLTTELALAQRGNKMLALLFLDLDHFKGINDGLGHSAGDLLLQQAAQRLRSSCRASDIVARLGGDEFAIIVPDVEKIQDVTTVAKNILGEFSNCFVIEDNECFVNASIGIATYPNDGDNSEILLRNADTAMYRAKATGRGRFVYFEEQMNKAAMEHITLEREIRQGLSRKEFMLHYQPKLDLRNEKMAGVEALVRWNHPTRGLVYPDKFIEIAEDIGLIEELGTQVIQMACAQYSAWNNAQIPIPHIAVNVSIRQFRQRRLVNIIKDALASTSMSPNALQIEVTESLFMDDRNEVMSTIEEIRSMGVKVAIDDFGTGYSSLSYLKNLPIDILKIDKSFVDNMITDASSRALCKLLLELAHTLDKTVVAEGVETQHQLDILRDWQCDIVQGYFYGKPLAPDKLVEFVHEKMRKV